MGHSGFSDWSENADRIDSATSALAAASQWGILGIGLVKSHKQSNRWLTTAALAGALSLAPSAMGQAPAATQPEAATQPPATSAPSDSNAPAVAEPNLVPAPSTAGASAAEPKTDKAEAVPTNNGAPATPAASEEQTVSFSFADADWNTVFQWIAKLTNKTLRVEATPSGKFSYFDTRTYTIPEAIDVLNTVLLDKGFILLVRDNFMIVANLANGIPPHLVERIELKDLPKRGDTELVKVLLDLRGISATNAKSEFESLVGPFGTLVPLPSTNQLLVVDTAKNIRQLVDLLQLQEEGGGKAALRAFPLKYISAINAERVIRELLGVSPRSSNSAAAAGGGRDPRESFRRAMSERFGRRDRGGESPNPADIFGALAQGAAGGGGPEMAAAGATSQTNVSVDERTNTLFVTATPDKLMLVTEVIRTIDIPGNENQANAPQATRIQVYPVDPGTAEGLTRAISSMFQGSSEISASAHPDGSSLIVRASPSDHERISALIDQLRGESAKIDVIPLKVLDASTTARLLKTIWGTQEDSRTPRLPFFGRGNQAAEETPAPTIEADTTSNRLIVRGTANQITEIRDVLTRMGERSLSDKSTGPERFRVMPVGDRDPKEVAETIERIWNRMETNNPVRVEVFGDAESLPPENERRGGGGFRPGSGGRPGPGGRRGGPMGPGGDDRSSTGDAEINAQVMMLVNYLEEEEAADATTSAATQQTPPKNVSPATDPAPLPTTDTLKVAEPSKMAPPEKKKPVTIVVGPDSIAIASDDPEALELMENLVASMVRTNEQSAASDIAVFYLKDADAQDMAYLVEEALYGQRNPFYNEDTSLRARILPDTRTNSLVVVGSPAEQRKIAQILKVLDNDDRPPSSNEVQPRLLPVKYANASEIAKVVREVFAQDLFQQASPQQGEEGGRSRRGGFSSFLMAGMNKKPDDKKDLTIGVDERTNTLIVGAPQALYEDVERMVHALDEAAKNNQRTAKVVTLKNAKPEAIQKALNSLFNTRGSESGSSAASSGQTARTPSTVRPSSSTTSPRTSSDSSRSRGSGERSGRSDSGRSGGGSSRSRRQ